jgi:hypothetical protein
MKCLISSPYPILQLIGILILLKLGYCLFGIALSKAGYISPSYCFSLESYTDMSMRKDAYWYKIIATDGYPQGVRQADQTRQLDFTEGQSSWAFFPFYPVSNRWIKEVMQLEYEQAAFLTSILFSLAAIIGCYYFFMLYWKDADKAFFTTVLIFVFPFHFYFSMFLSEGPFLAFLIWSFYAAKKNRPVLLSILLIPLILLRPNGMVLFLPLFLYILEQKDIPILQFFCLKKGFKNIFVFLPAVLCFIGYCFYQKAMTGYYFAFSEAQQGWGKEFMFPLLALFRRGDVNYQVTSFYAVFIILLLLVKWKRFPLSFNIMILISVLLPLSAGSTYGMIRYMSVVFPLFIIITDQLFFFRRKVLILSLLFFLQLGSFYLWLADFPLGF